jgi:hypothetical protein
MLILSEGLPDNVPGVSAEGKITEQIMKLF